MVSTPDTPLSSLMSAIAPFLDGKPIGFIDVGMRGGIHPLAEPLGQAVAVLGFEPDPLECARIIAAHAAQPAVQRLECEAVALSDSAGSATLHEIVAATNSSLLPPNPAFVERYRAEKWREVGQSKIRTTTLDSILFGGTRPEPEWGEAIKIDTQGTEHEILSGALRTLKERTLFLCVEVSFCELYLGQKLFSDVEALLRQNGFAFYGFDRIYNRSRKSLDKRKQWGRERIIQADAYFFRDPFGRRPVHQVNRRQCAILAALALVTGFHDFALELLDSLGPDASEARRMVLRHAELPATEAVSDVQKLAAAVKATPSEANVIVGRFVDERRSRNDVYDVI